MKAIIFDFDGVIHDTRDDLFKLHKQFFPNEKLKNWLSEAFGKNAREYINIKFSKEQQKTFEKLWTEVHRKLKIHVNMKKFLLELKKEYSLFIITSNTEKNIELYFNSNNINNLFSKILGAETHHSKIEKFKILFKVYNLNPDEVLFITDTLGDILEANEVYVKTIAVDFGYHNKTELKKGNPFKIASSLDEISKIIKEIN